MMLLMQRPVHRLCVAWSFLLVVTTVLFPGGVHMKPTHYTSRPGGYAPIADLRAERVVAAAAFAVQSLRRGDDTATPPPPPPDYSFSSQLSKEAEEKEEITIVQGSQQVVAGMNYQLTLVLSTTDEIIGAFVVTVYDKFGSLSVTHWGRELTLTEAKSLLEQQNANRLKETPMVEEYQVPEDSLL
jgi:hypothetical protein